MPRILIAAVAVTLAAGCNHPLSCYIAPTAGGYECYGDGSLPISAPSAPSIPSSCAGQAVGVTCTIGVDGGGGGGLGTCCGQGCSDLTGDPANCGACGNACVSGETCLQGSCAFDQCHPEFQGDPCHLEGGLALGTCCGTTCVQTTRNAQNCGGCNLDCGAASECVDSQCH